MGRKIISIALNDLLKLTRDRMALVFMFLIPIVFTFIMGMAFGNLDDYIKDGRIAIGVVDADISKQSDMIITSLNQDDNFKVKIMGKDELYSKVKEGVLEVGLIIPKNFARKIENGQTPEVTIIKIQDSANVLVLKQKIETEIKTLYISDVVDSYLQEHQKGNLKNLDEKALREKIEESVKESGTVIIKPVGGGKDKKQYDSTRKVSLGYIVMFVMFAAMFGAGILLEEKLDGTWQRINSTPIGVITMYLGKVLGLFFKCWVQVLFLVVFLTFSTDIDWGKSIIPVVLILNLYIFCIISIMMFISSLSKTNAQYDAITGIFVMSTSMLAGCWWPIEIVPILLQKVALLLPQYWTIQALADLILGNEGISYVVIPSLILLATGIIFLIVGAVRGNFKFYFKKILRLETTEIVSRK